MKIERIYIISKPKKRKLFLGFFLLHQSELAKKTSELHKSWF